MFGYKKINYMKGLFSYLLTLIFISQSILPAWAQVPPATAVPTTSAVDTALQTTSPVDTVDRSRLNEHPLPEGTLSPREIELGDKVKKDLQEDPNLETDARIKFNKSKQAIDKESDDEIVKVKKNKNLSSEEKDRQILIINARRERAVDAEKEKFAKDLGFDNFEQVKRAGIADPASNNTQKRGSSAVASTYMNPTTYMEYIIMLSAGIWGPMILRGCFPEVCPVASIYIFGIGLAIYIIGEILHFLMYKEASSKKLRIDRDKNFDQQEQAVKKAKQVTEEAAKAAKMKSIILSVASATMILATVVSAVEWSTDTAGCASVVGSAVFCKCLIKDVNCAALLGQCPALVDGRPNTPEERKYKIDGVNLQRKMIAIWEGKEEKKLLDEINERSNETKKMKKTIGSILKNSIRPEVVFLLMQEWHGIIRGSIESPSMMVWNNFLQVEKNPDPYLKENLQSLAQLAKSNAFSNLVEMEEMIVSNGIMDSLVSSAHADNGKTGVAASLGIGVVLAVILGIVAKTNCYAVGNMLRFPSARFVVFLLYSAAAAATSGMAVSAADDLQEHADKYGKLEKEIKQLKSREGQIEEDIGGAPDGKALINAAATDYANKKLLEEKDDYSDLPTSCFRSGKDGSIDQDTNCDCKKVGKCLKVEAPTLKPTDFKNFSNSLGTMQLASDNSAKTLNSLGNGDLNGAAATGQASARLALALNKKLDKFKDYINKDILKGKNPVDKQVDTLRRELYAGITKAAKKNNVDLAKELGARFSVSPPSSDDKGKEVTADKKSDVPVPTPISIDLSAFGASGSNIPINLDQDEATPMAEPEETPALGMEDYEMNANADVVQDPGVSIWQVLSVRYIKTAMPTLLEEKNKSDHPPLIEEKTEIPPNNLAP